MKRRRWSLLFGSVLMATGFVGGCLFQHAKSGYRFKVLSEKEYQSTLGVIRWSLVTESIGMPFLDAGTTIIRWNDRTIYKAERVFQKDTPIAANVRIANSTIKWDDGEYHYDLDITVLPKSSATN